MNILSRLVLPAALLLFVTVAASAADAEKVRFTAADGYPLAALLAEPATESRAGVVLLHIYRGSKEDWRPLLPALTARGLTALAVDLRGHGDSRRGPEGNDNRQRVVERDEEFFRQMHRDAEAAVRYLIEEQGIDRHHVGLAGASVGASIAIQTAAADRVPVAAVVVMTPGEEYLGLPTLEHIENWKGQPLLILTSAEEKDRGAAAIDRRLRDEGAELRVFEETGIHGTRMLGEVKGVEALIADWLAARLVP